MLRKLVVSITPIFGRITLSFSTRPIFRRLSLPPPEQRYGKFCLNQTSISEICFPYQIKILHIISRSSSTKFWRLTLPLPDTVTKITVLIRKTFWNQCFSLSVRSKFWTSSLSLSHSLSLSLSLSLCLCLFQAEDLLYLHIRLTVIKLVVSIKPTFQRVALSTSGQRYENLSPADKDFRELLCLNAIKKILVNFSVSIGPAFRILLYLRNPDVQLTHNKAFSTMNINILFFDTFIFRHVVSILDFWWKTFQQYRIVVSWYYDLINKHVQLYK